MALCTSSSVGSPATITAYPTYCSESRATNRAGTGGERHPYYPVLSRDGLTTLLSNTNAPATSDRNQTRRRIRDNRNTISIEKRRLAESQVAKRLLNMASFRRAHHVSIYFAIDGECSLQKFMVRATRSDKQFYAPVIRDENLCFALLRPGITMKLNRFGIPEPSDGPYINARSLDLVLTPLVAFDDRGCRLGMGGGYYDRSFHFLRQRATWLKPKLIGVGFELQHLSSIDMASWDVRLWSAVTEKSCRYFF